jgi:hypothetical protein
MHTNTLMEPKTGVKAKLRLFALYADFPAGVRAKRLISRIRSLSGQKWELFVELWKLSSVSPVGPIREMIAEEAGESDVLLVVISSVDQPDPGVIRWLDSLVHSKANRPLPGLIIGLPGDEEHKVDETNWFVDYLVQFARKTHMDVAWQTAGHDHAEDGDWLVAGLERLLDRKSSGERSATRALPYTRAA